jgi:hypothetical protein
MLIGNKERFAAEIGEFCGNSPALRRVDLWAANRWWTCDDNMVYVPQFHHSVQFTVDRLRSGGINLLVPFKDVSPADAHRRILAEEADEDSPVSWDRFWFESWGPTTDNVISRIFREQGRVWITFEFWREDHHDPDELGRVFVAELAEEELISVLEQLLLHLS